MVFGLTPKKNAKGRPSNQSGTPSSASGHRQDSSPSDEQEAKRPSQHHQPRRHGGYSTQNAHSRAMVPDNRRAAERDDPEETDTYTSGVITSKDPVPTTKKFTRTEKNPATRPSTSRTGTNKKPTGATEEVACPKKVCANGFSFSCTGTNIKLIRATEEVPANRSDTSRTGTSKESVRVPKEVTRSKKAPDKQFYLQRKSSKSDRGPRLQAAKDSKRGKGLGAERDLVVPRRTPSSKVKQTPVSDSQVQQEAYGVSEPSIEPARTHRGRTSPVEMHTLRAPYPMGVGPPTGSEERTRGRRCQSLGGY